MFKKLLASFLLCFPLLACSHIESRVEQRVEPHLDHVDIYQPPPVELSKRALYVRPGFPSPPNLKAIIFPFWLDQDLANKKNIGRETGRIIWQTWAEKQIFSQLIYDEHFGWPGRKEARRIALEKNAQLYILGQITNYLPGGSQGSTNIGISLRIYNAKDDNLLWSMQQSGRIDPRPDMDFILFKRKNWMPDSPLYMLVRSLASSFSAPVYEWTHPYPRK
ncbi:MAG: hypothetical protein ACQES5_00100 [Thermodesulfobacteriota bacterium]